VSQVVAVAPVLPPYRYPQQEITDALAGVVLPDGSDRRLLDRVHGSAGVTHRNLALPLDAYATLRGFGAANDAFIEVGCELGGRAVKEALADAGLRPDEVDLMVTTSVTGIAAPSLDARLIPVLGLRSDIRRVPMFGLGCTAGAAGLARVSDLLRGDPDGVAVLLSVELCSLTVQRDDTSVANLVASGLFGDGAAAVVMVGDRRAAALGLPGPAVVGSASRVYPGTERALGWDIVDTGFRIVLSADIPSIVESHLGGDVTEFLASHGLAVGDVDEWVVHPGGPKVLDAAQAALGLPDAAMHRTRASLSAVGNLSSSSVLHQLAELLGDGAPRAGTTAVVLAMGPGFATESVLLQW
jgi:alkylresorcinol/alkylpyrone synthase